MTNDYLTITELATALRVSRTTARKIARSIPGAFKAGETVRIPRKGLEDYKQEREYGRIR